MHPKFSIVIPTFNRADLLRQTVESALRQDGFDDYEVVAVDDCSGDGTWDYLQGVRDPKLRAIRNERRLGMGPNWNKAVRSSAGEYVFILQDDDLALPNLLGRASGLIEKYVGVDLICSATCLIDSEGGSRRLFWQHPREELWPAPQALMYFARNWTLSSTQVIFSRATFDRYGEFDLTLPIMSDAEAILRWMIHATTLVTPEVLALRRSWPGSVTSATERSPEMLETMERLVEGITQLSLTSGRFDAAQSEELRRRLQDMFVDSYLVPGTAVAQPPRTRRRGIIGLLSKLRN